MGTLSSAKQEGMVDVNLRSGNANSSHSQRLLVQKILMKHVKVLLLH